MSIRLLFASQILLGKETYTRPDGSTGYGYLGCGVSSDWHLAMLATDNEAGQNKFARQRGKAARRAVLKRGWRAFKSRPDANGIVDRDDIPRVHAAMFPNLPQPTAYSTEPSWVWDRIGKHAHSLAIDPGAVGSGDAIRRYVGAFGHQVVVYKRKTINNVRWVKIVDPMHPHSERYTGHWVKWDSLRKCALKIGGGKMLGFIAPVGGWTKAERVRERKDAVINEKERTIARVRGDRDAAIIRADTFALENQSLSKENNDLVIENVALTEQLTECRQDTCDATVEALLDQLHEWETEHRP